LVGVGVCRELARDVGGVGSERAEEGWAALGGGVRVDVKCEVPKALHDAYAIGGERCREAAAAGGKVGVFELGEDGGAQHGEIDREPL
jgi:hypothetical protein